MHRAVVAARELLFPPCCAGCGRADDDLPGGWLCLACRERLAADLRARCSRCARLAPEVAADCVDCAAGGKRGFAAVVCLGSYERELRDAVLRTKRAAEFPLAFALANLLLDRQIETMAAWRVDRVVAMPMHWMRRFVRGANGPDLIAQQLSRRLGAADVSRSLVRRRNTPPQASLPPSARHANVRGAFRVRRPSSVAGSRVLLVDDVMTTGSTCREAASTLRAAGATEVFVAVVARADT